MADAYLGDFLFAVQKGLAPVPTKTHGRIRAEDLGENEAWLQRAIAANPELVIGPCRSADLVGNETWKLWKHELSIPGVGAVDLALVSERGRVALVEAKLSFNPGKRREVVAQLLEYALHAREVDPLEWPDLPSGPSGGPFADTEEVHRSLASGEVLLIIAGDELDSGAVKLSQSLLGSHLLTPWDLALVDVALYQASDGSTVVCVPHLRGMVVADTRQVVTVRVDSTGGPTKVEIEHVESEAASAARGRWTLERFRSVLDENGPGPGYADLINEVSALPSRHSDVTLHGGRGASGSITVKRRGAGILELYDDGQVWVRPSKARRALGDEAASKYFEGLRRLFPELKGGEDGEEKLRVPRDAVERQAAGLRELIERSLTAADGV